MPRAVDGTRRKNRRKKILKQAKSHAYAYRDRRVRRREFRSLWITRISAGCRAEGISYSRFINGLMKANIEMDRKSLSNLAIQDKKAFQELVAQAKGALTKAK
jgi:large subunit ribosomal protein L20